MNDISSDDPAARGPSGLDPELLQLFDVAPAHGPGPSIDPHDEAFVAAIMVKLRAARRRRLLARLIVTTLIIVSGALLAPYAAQVTLEIASWVTLYYPVACGCAALIAWRIARRPLN
jgi:hypothetical protein